MPNLNGTGPDGHGPLTGRNRGDCKSDGNKPVQNSPEFNNSNAAIAGRRPCGRGPVGRPGGSGRKR